MTDFDGDGMLDLILSHGESMAQPISIFKGTQVSQAAGPRVVPIPSTSPCSVSLLPCRAPATTGCASSPAPASGPLRGGPKWCCSHGAVGPTCASLTVDQDTSVRWSLWHILDWVSWGDKGHTPGQEPPLLSRCPAAW